MKYFKLFFFAFVLFSCSSATEKEPESVSEELTEDVVITKLESAILDSANIDEEIFKWIRVYTDSSIAVLKTTSYSYNPEFDNYEGITTVQEGIYFNASQDGARNTVLELKDKLKAKGYLIYISESNYGYAPDELTLLKTADQFKILEVEGTDGTNWGLSNADIIAQLKEWNKQYPFEIVGAGFDYIEAIFLEDPKNEDMTDFAQEVYQFCPDIVDQGTGSVKELEKEMKKSGMLYLWWD